MSKLPLSVIVALALTPTGCRKDSPPTAAPIAATGADLETGANGNTDPVNANGTSACRDWSTLDPGTLPALPESEYTETFEHAWVTVLTRHYDPTIGCTNWPQLRAEYGKKVAAAKTQAEAYDLMNAMLRELKQSHMVIVPPGTESKGEPRSGEAHPAGVVPIRVAVLGDALIITDASAYGLRSTLPAGASVTKVGDHEVAELVTSMRTEYARPVEANLRITRTVAGWLACPTGSKQSVTYVASGTAAAKTKAVKCREPELERVSMGNMQNFPSEFEARLIKDTTTGYIRFNVWMMPLLEKIEAGVADLRKQGASSLVIDLRGNPGGVGMMAVPVARLLLDQEVSLGVMTMRETTQHFNVTPQGEPFSGPIVLLVDEGTGSTSEIFAQAMQDLGRVRVVGSTPSQGAVLASFIEKLPGGATLQFVVADYKSPNGTLVEGKGVHPDVLVDVKAEDYVNGHDPVLDAAVKAVSQQG